MNKKLLALAIGASVAMPALALADGPTLYGKLNVSLENVEDELGMDPDLAWPADPAATSAEGWVLRNNASRIGIKGSADTNVDGLKGIYKAEYGVDPDNGAGPFTQRDIWVGLQGDFGTVLLGNMDTPTKAVQGKVDQFNDTTVDMSNHVGGELRAPNVVAYASPKIADSIVATIALWQGEGVEGAGSNPVAGSYDALEGPADAISASVVYDNEGLYLGLGLDSETPRNSGLSNMLPIFVPVPAYVDTTRLVAGYNTDEFEVGFLYGTQEGATTGSTYEDTSMVVSGAFKTGDWKFKAQYGMTETDDLLPAAGDQSAEFTMTGIGADYALGKSTTASAFYAVEELDAGGSAERTVLSFGLEQKF
jgi:predicted porin